MRSAESLYSRAVHDEMEMTRQDSDIDSVTQLTRVPKSHFQQRSPVSLLRRVKELAKDLEDWRVSLAAGRPCSHLDMCVQSASQVLSHLSWTLEQQAVPQDAGSLSCTSTPSKGGGAYKRARFAGLAPTDEDLANSRELAEPEPVFDSVEIITKPLMNSEDMTTFQQRAKSWLRSGTPRSPSASKDLLGGSREALGGSQETLEFTPGSREALRAGDQVSSHNRCYLHPEHNFRLCWDACAMVLILILTVTIPLEVCFFFDRKPPMVLEVLTNVVDVFFGVDIVLNFFTAFHGRGASGVLVTDLCGIAKHYARGWLVLDFFASFPWVFAVGVFAGPSDGSSASEAMGVMRLLRYARIARMLKVLRVLKLGGLMQVVEEKMVAAQSMTVAFQLVKMTVVMLILSHNVACGWYACAVFHPDEDVRTWLHKAGVDEASGFQQYVAAFYFAITTGTTVGYGDITPVNTLEQVVTVFVLVLSVGYIGQFLARVSRMVSSLSKLEAELTESKREALLFMRKRSVPRELQFKVLRYIEQVFEIDAITHLDQRVMGLLSESLQQQMTLAVTGSILKLFPLFEDLDEDVLGDLCRVCRTHRAGISEEVVIEDERANEMFWVVRGEAAVTRRNNSVGSLKAGDWFGELSLFLAGAMRTATVHCETHCEFVCLHADDFKQVLERFPTVKKEYDKIATEIHKGNPRALKLKCKHCSSKDHFTRDCPRCVKS